MNAPNAAAASKGALLSDRLLALLEKEVARLEREAEGLAEGSHEKDGEVRAAMAEEEREAKTPRKPARAKGAGPAADAAAERSADNKKAGMRAATARGGTGTSAEAKARIDLLSTLTRTLEKLLELRRLERLSADGGEDDTAETERLRGEMMKRLRLIDAGRAGGPRLFGDDGELGGAIAGEGRLAAADAERGKPDTFPEISPAGHSSADRG